MDSKYLKKLLKSKGIKAHLLSIPLKCTNQTIYNAFNGLKRFTMEEAFIIKAYARMSEEEFETAFGDERWFELYRR